MKKIILFVVALCCSVSVYADPITKFVFLGDSLSDNGNLYSVFKIMPKSPPYYEGRFSNGPIWSDDIANFFLNKYNISSSNYATGGATIVFHNPFKGYLPYLLSEEIDHYLLHTFNQNRNQTLFFIWIGANDYSSGQADVDGSTTTVVNSLISSINRLIDHGGRHFLVLGLPDLASTPFAQTISFADNLHVLSVVHNAKLIQALDALQNSRKDVQVIYFDSYQTLSDVIAHPEIYNQKYNKNLTDLKDACWSGGYTINNKQNEINSLNRELQKIFISNSISNHTEEFASGILDSPDLAVAYETAQSYALGVTPCENPDAYLFWDKMHPTTVTHEIIANLVIEKILSEKML